MRADRACGKCFEESAFVKDIVRQAVLRKAASKSGRCNQTLNSQVLAVLQDSSLGDLLNQPGPPGLDDLLCRFSREWVSPTTTPATDHTRIAIDARIAAAPAAWVSDWATLLTARARAKTQYSLDSKRCECTAVREVDKGSPWPETACLA